MPRMRRLYSLSCGAGEGWGEGEMKLRRRHTFKLMLVLLAGAIINVAVAWGITMMLPAPLDVPGEGYIAPRWVGIVPSSWPAPMFTRVRRSTGRIILESESGEVV